MYNGERDKKVYLSPMSAHCRSAKILLPANNHLVLHAIIFVRHMSYTDAVRVSPITATSCPPITVDNLIYPAYKILYGAKRC